MSEKVKVQFKDGSILEIQEGMDFEGLYNLVNDKSRYPVMLAQVGNAYKELSQPIMHDIKDVGFVHLDEKDGMRVYQRSVSFLLVAAAKRILPNSKVIINHHIAGGYFCEFESVADCTRDNIVSIENMMKQMVAEELDIKKGVVPIDDAIEMFEQEHMLDKKQLFKYRRTSSVNIYTLDGTKDYFYGYMVTNTKSINLFRLIPYSHGFILQFPNEKDPDHLSEFIAQPKLSSVFRESEKWARILGVDTVGALNDIISHGDTDELIKVSEALHEKKMAQIADLISAKGDIKLILIAGPSSSGKTTSAKRLSIQLRVNGMKPHVISIDDYFVNREDTPLDENGKYDFEALEAIDIKLFNEHMKDLIDGKQIEMPTFNFKTGKREYKGNFVKLHPEEVLIVEGIHGLNEKLSYAIKPENKFKLYVSCLTQLNIDHHNRIPTTDPRLIRRMVRDNQYRGIDPEKTLEIWSSVRRGENKNIFPFQEEADAMLNTVLIYELAVLKSKAEPLLFRVSRQSPYYAEAKRMLKFLEYFLPMDTSEIPSNSLIREFLGGSSFN